MDMLGILVDDICFYSFGINLSIFVRKDMLSLVGLRIDLSVSMIDMFYWVDILFKDSKLLLMLVVGLEK